MKYTLWFYDCKNGQLYKAYEVFTRTRYQCYKLRKTKTFSWQYKVLRCTW